MRKTLPVIVLAILAACGAKSDDAPPPALSDPAHVALAETLVPADATLAAIYDRSCRTCHALDGLGAPLTGDSAAWAPRLEERGMDGMLASIHSGRNTMPAMGYCPDCTDEDFHALVEFMSTEGLP